MGFSAQHTFAIQRRTMLKSGLRAQNAFCQRGEEHPKGKLVALPHAWQCRWPVRRSAVPRREEVITPPTAQDDFIVVPGCVASTSDRLTLSSVSCLITFNKFLFCLRPLESENASWVLVKELIIYLTIRKIWSSKKQKCICHSFWILAVYVKLPSLVGPLKTFVEKCW